jgi:hypothetical protein
MIRYVRTHPHPVVEVGGLVFVPEWRRVDVTDDQLARIVAAQQLEVSETPPESLSRVTFLTADELAVEVGAATLVPGGLYYATDAGTLSVATDGETLVVIGPAEPE